MRRKINLRYIWRLTLLLVLFQSCGKKWLEAKPDPLLAVPTTITDFQALLDNTTQVFNVSQAVGLAEISSGDFYITFPTWASLFNVQERSAYIWAATENFYSKEQSFDWVNSYKRILNANLILEGIDKIKPATSEQQDWNNVRGSALFFRAFDFFNLSQEYCVAYNANTASRDLGLPLRLEYNVNVQVKRSKLQQTYERILADLQEASTLLASKPPYKTRPSKEAVYALLARIYLAMENYGQAGKYADLALQIQSDLMDYSKLNSGAPYAISKFNTEVIFHSSFTYGIFNPSRLTVEPSLYNEYASEDYRKDVFFATNANGMAFRGNYTGDRSLFGGLATDEMYLIRAEAKARNNELILALADLNHLRRSRWKGICQDLISSNPNVVLDFVLKERRKELAFRGLRWTDLRRLNKDARYAVTLSRVLNGTTYTLQPNDKRYVFPIDEEEMRLSGIEQNER